MSNKTYIVIWARKPTRQTMRQARRTLENYSPPVTPVPPPWVMGGDFLLLRRDLWPLADMVELLSEALRVYHDGPFYPTAKERASIANRIRTLLAEL